MSDKTYRIGEAAAKLNLKTYVLRFWEMEFSEIAPVRTEKGQRLYREADMVLLARIKYLLHERGLTIEGARRLLREEAARGVTYAADDAAFPGVPGEMAYPDPDGATEEADFDDGADDPKRDSPGYVGPHGSQGTASVVQASLFPAGAAGKYAFASEDVPDIIAELTAIRNLLTF